MSAITTHVLDTALGVPAAGVPVRLELVGENEVTLLGEGVTNADGRVADIGPEKIEAGKYRLRFDVTAYGTATNQTYFFTEVDITFTPTDFGRHYHVPLLLSPFAYSAYRGS